MAFALIKHIVQFISGGTPTDVSAANPLPVNTGLTTQTDALTNTQLRASLVEVNDVAGAITPLHLTVNTSGETSVVQPSAGNSIRLWWYNIGADPVNSANVVASLRFGSSGTDFFKAGLSQYGGAAGHSFKAGKSYHQGGVDESLYVNLSAAQTVYVNIDYEQV